MDLVTVEFHLSQQYLGLVYFMALNLFSCPSFAGGGW